jgi:O-antigen ligase
MLFRKDIGPRFHLPVIFITVMGAMLCFSMNEATITWRIMSVFAVMFAAMICVLLYSKKNIPFFFLCLFVFFISIDMTKAIRSGGRVLLFLSLADLASYVMIAGWFFEMFIEKKRKLYYSKIYTIFFMFVIWGLVTLIKAPSPALGIIVFLTQMKYFVLCAVIVSLVDSKKRLKTVIFVIMVSIFIQGIYVLLQASFSSLMNIQGLKMTPLGRNLYYGGMHSQLTRPAGTFHHPNVLASYMVFLLPIFAGLAIRKKNVLLKVPAYATVSIGGIALILSYSRGGWVGFAFGVFLMLIVCIERKFITIKMFLRILLMGFITAVLLFPFWKPIIWRFTKPDDSATLVRVVLIKQAWLMLQANPVTGVGSGNYYGASVDYIPAEVWDSEFIRGVTVHNRYMAIASETGYVGLFLFLWFLWSIGQCCYKNIKCRDDYLAYVSLGLLAGLAGTMLHMQFDHFQDDLRNTLFWFATAMIIAIRVYCQRNELDPE